MKVDKGTNETREKLKPDPIERMVREKRIDLDQLNAIDEIDRSFRMITHASSHIKVHVVERASPSHDGEYQPYREVRLEKDFRRWARELLRRKLDLSSALDIIVFRFSPHSVDRVRKQKNGRAYENLVNSLDLYCRLKGWKERI